MRYDLQLAEGYKRTSGLAWGGALLAVPALLAGAVFGGQQVAELLSNNSEVQTGVTLVFVVVAFFLCGACFKWADKVVSPWLEGSKRWKKEQFPEFADILTAQHGVSGLSAADAEAAVVDFFRRSKELADAARSVSRKYPGPPPVMRGELPLTVFQGSERVTVFLGRDTGDWSLVHESDEFQPLPRIDV